MLKQNKTLLAPEDYLLGQGKFPATAFRENLRLEAEIRLFQRAQERKFRSNPLRYPVFSRQTGKLTPETGSQMPASTAS